MISRATALPSSVAPVPLITNLGGRSTISLDGTWRFVLDPYRSGYLNIFGEPDRHGWHNDAAPTSSRDRIEYDFDASAMAIFDMTDGIVFNYRGSWCSEGLNTSWQCQWRIVGEKGTVTWDGEDGLEAQTVAGSDGKNSTLKDHSIPTDGISPDKIGSHGGIIREFLRCVRTGETPETTARDNLKSLAMVDGAVQSAGNNSVVSIAT